MYSLSHSIFLAIPIFLLFLLAIFFLVSGQNSRFDALRRFHRNFFVDYILRFEKTGNERFFIFSVNYRYFIFCLPLLTMALTAFCYRISKNLNNNGIVITLIFSIIFLYIIFRNMKTYKFNVDGVRYVNALGFDTFIIWDDVVKIWIRHDGFTLSSRTNDMKIDIVKPPLQNAIPIPAFARIRCSPLDLQNSKKEIERGMKLFEKYARKRLRGRNVLWSI
jgi:hypothetical protein